MGNVLGGGAPKASAAVPKALETDKKKEAKKARTSLFATEGGVLGSQVQDEDIRERRTLLGNQIMPSHTKSHQDRTKKAVAKGTSKIQNNPKPRKPLVKTKRRPMLGKQIWPHS